MFSSLQATLQTGMQLFDVLLEGCSHPSLRWSDLNLLQQLISNCPNAQGNTADCPALAAVQDGNAAAACQFNGQIVDEDIGLFGPINVLPGCNLPWDGTGAQPTCSNLPTPGFVDAIQPLPSGWTDLGCIAEGTNGRALTNASLHGSNMTKAVCVASCADAGFMYAGVEFGDVSAHRYRCPSCDVTHPISRNVTVATR